MPPAYPAFGLPFCPLSPQPPSPAGKGENITLFRRGLRPRHPCIKPFAALIVFAAVVPSGGLVPGVAVSAGVSGTLRGACPLYRPPTLPLVCLFAPYPPNPLPRQGRGRFFCFLMQGASPLASPAFNRLRHLQNLPSRCPAGGLPRRHWLDLPIRHSTGACLRHRQFAAKPTETLSYERCRQPRRGGTGGEELRRLRWSSPPGQGEQVPRGGKPPCPPQGTTAAGQAGDRPPCAPRRTPQRLG